MRSIHIAHLEKPRPVLVLTRETVRPYLSNVTVAPITGTIRGLSTEVLVGPRNGLEQESVVSCDNITTVRADSLGDQIGFLHPDQELELARAIELAFDLA